MSTSYKTSSFPHFALLPLELRLIIWDLALPGPRVIEIYSKDVSCVAGKIYNYPHRSGVKVISSIPALLHTTRESRAVTSEVFYPYSVRPLGMKVYIDVTQDFLYFNHLEAFMDFAYFSKGWLDRVVNKEKPVRTIGAEVRHMIMARPAFFSTSCGRQVLNYPNLRTLLVNKGGYETSEKGIGCIERKFRTLRGEEAKMPLIRFLAQDDVEHLVANMKTGYEDFMG